MGGSAGVAVLLLSKLKFLLLGLTKISTVTSMFAFFGVYWSLYGWPLALGLVMLVAVSVLVAALIGAAWAAVRWRIRVIRASAERFKVLEGLFPGRIDLGIGRALPRGLRLGGNGVRRLRLTTGSTRSRPVFRAQGGSPWQRKGSASPTRR